MGKNKKNSDFSFRYFYFLFSLQFLNRFSFDFGSYWFLYILFLFSLVLSYSLVLRYFVFAEDRINIL